MAAADTQPLEKILSRARSTYTEQADLMVTLLEHVWWVKSRLEEQHERMAQMEESLERQATRIATLEAGNTPAPASTAVATRASSTSSVPPANKAVDLLDLEEASPKPAPRQEWADVQDDEDEEQQEEVSGKSDGKLAEEARGPADPLETDDPWSDAVNERRASPGNFLAAEEKPAAAPSKAFSVPKAAAKATSPARTVLEQDSAPLEPLPQVASRPKARAKPEVSPELMNKLMQAVHAKKLMDSPEGPPATSKEGAGSNGSNGSNGSSPPQQKAAPENLQNSGKVATKALPVKPKAKPAPPMLKNRLPENGS